MTLLFIIAVVGMTHIVVRGEIMEPADEWAKAHLPADLHHGLFECYQCSGFWCGVLLSPIVLMGSGFYLLCSPAVVLTCILVVFACGCAGSFLADFSESTFKYLERNDAS